MASFRKAFRRIERSFGGGRSSTAKARSQLRQAAARPKSFADLLRQAQTLQQDSLAAQPELAGARQRGLEAIRGLQGQIFAESPERQLGVQNVRAAQAARGVALSPASALQEGLQLSAQQNQFERQNLDLFGREMDLLNIGGLGLQGGQFLQGVLGGEQGRVGAAQQFAARREGSREAVRAQQLGLLTTGLTALAGGGLGAAGFLGEGVGFGGGFAAGLLGITPQGQQPQGDPQTQTVGHPRIPTGSVGGPAPITTTAGPFQAPFPGQAGSIPGGDPRSALERIGITPPGIQFGNLQPVRGRSFEEMFGFRR